MFVKNSETSFSDAIETARKMFLLLLYPTAVTAIGCWFWWSVFFEKLFITDDKLREIVLTGFLPLVGGTWILMAAVILNYVWSKYMDMRMSNKCVDVNKFVNLKDENLSPVVHLMMVTLSIGILAPFWVMQYPDAESGFWVVGGVNFFLAFIFFIAKEIDHPLKGIWVIKNIHEELMAIDPKKWREQEFKKEKGRILKKIQTTTTTTEVIE